MKLADEANLAAESLLGSVGAQRFLEQLRALRLIIEMTRTAQNGTIPAPQALRRAKSSSSIYIR